MRIVTGGNKEVSIRAELYGTGVMTTFAALLAKFEHHLLARHIQNISLQDKAAQALAGVIGGRIIEVNPIIFYEMRIQCET